MKQKKGTTRKKELEVISKLQAKLEELDPVEDADDYSKVLTAIDRHQKIVNDIDKKIIDAGTVVKDLAVAVGRGGMIVVMFKAMLEFETKGTVTSGVGRNFLSNVLHIKM